MHLNKNHTFSRRALAMLLTLTLCLSLVPSAFAAQQNSYHDPAEHWMQASNRTNELDVNSVVTRETFKCGECGKVTSFEVFRVPEYTRNGQTALSRNVKYSDGTMMDGVGKGDCMDGVPGKDAYYTGYHYTKAVCETCGGINTNEPKSDYGYLKNVYWLFDCAAEFTQKLEETVTYEYTDDTYHTVTTKGGTYCAFCYGTNHTVNSTLERHSMETEVLPQPANGRFATVEKCSLCDYASYDYTAAKAVIADYYGVVDGQPHTITVSDLSETGVRTSIRYGNSAESCTMTSAPNYTEEGQYTVYYEITYTYQNVSMTENGVANVWLRDTQASEDGKCTCGCDDPNCGCQNKHCNGNCCADKGCGENHHFILLDRTKAGCTTLGYDRYLCTECGKIEKRDYVDSLGHAWQSIVIRDATCETDGKLLELCSRCGQMKQTATPKGEHQYKTYPVAATCTNPGYTIRECSVCGDRHIEDITSVLPHNYESHVIAATCEGGGKTIHRCDGCGSSFVTDYTAPLVHSWDEGTLITNATCTGEGVMEYRCVRCGYHRIEGNEAAGHIPGNPATCTEPQLCTRCGAVLKNALGHDYTSEVTAPTCTEMGYTTNTCTRCGDSNKSDYTEPTGHKPGDWIIDKEPTTDSEGSKHKECENCGETLETAEIDKIYNSGTTDSRGEAIVGGYLVTVTDTDTKDPVANAAVTLHKDNSISIRLPNSRLLDYADQTTVTVQLVKDKSAVPGMGIAVTDKNDNYSSGKTDAAGQITVPTGSGKTNEDGKVTGGYEDADGNRWTLTVKVIRTDTKRPIPGSDVSIGKTGNISIILPDGTDTEVKKRELFAKVRSGQVRVLMGSTAKMGAGTNVQDRLVALHDLDCPWRPRDLTQRKGRIERQGNQNKLVHVCRYVTEGTFDAYLWQTVENKQKFISQIMTSKSPVRSCEDVDATALSFAEIKALCAGDPRIKERMDLDIEVSKLKIMKADHNSKQFRLEDSLLKYFPEKIEEHKGFVRGLEADMQTLAAHPLPAEGFVGMEIRGDRLTDKENAGAALLDTCKEVKGKDPVQIGSYRGFTMSVAFDSMWKTYTLTLKGQMTHRVELGSDARGNLVRIENALDKMPERLRSVQEQLENLYNQQAAAKAEVGKPFPQEQELAAKTARLIELDMELNLDGKGQPQPEQAIAKSTRPSVLDRLKAPPVHGAPEKPHKKEMEAR